MSLIRLPLLAFFLFAPFALVRAEDLPDYAQDIAPIFNKYCTACHNADDREGKLSLDSFDELNKGGKRGAAISAGHSDQSLLIRVLTGQAKPEMPPDDNEKPKPEEIELLRNWIDAGAKGPQGVVPDPTILITPKIAPSAAVRRAITAVAYSPQGDLIAVGRHSAVELVAADTRSVRRTLTGHAGPVNEIVFSADGSRLIAASGETGLYGEARIWSTADGKLLKSIRGHKDAIYALALSPDNKTLATGSYDQAIKLWDLDSGSEKKTLAGHNGGVFGLAFHIGGKLLASASGDRTVKLWDVERGERLDTFGQPLGDQYTVAISPDGRFVAAGGVDNRIRLWRLSDTAAEGTNELVYSRFAHDQPIVKLAFSPDGQTLASAAEDRQVKYWRADNVTERVLLEPQGDVAAAIAFAPKSDALAVGRLDGVLVVYNGADGKPVPPTPPARPELTAVSPRAVERGKPATLTLKGKNLGDIANVAFSDNRLSAQVVSQSAEEARIEVASAADLPRAAYEIWLENAGGSSAKLKLHVDDLPQLAEVEPDDLSAQSQSIATPASVWGAIQAQGDVDQYTFEGKANETVVLELASASIGGKGNLVLALLDGSGKQLAGNNDFDGTNEPLVAYALPADGRYTVRVNELAMLGGDGFDYRLTVGAVPFVVGCYPLSVPANQESDVELIGYNLPAERTVKVKAGASGEVAVPIDTNKFRTRRGLKLIASDTPDLRETEPNDAPNRATAMSAPGSANGRIESRSPDRPADADFFRFDAKAGQTFLIETNARRRGSPVDTRIEILTADGKPIERLILQAVRDSYINFRSITSTQTGVRLKNWEEMQLNEYVYFAGEVARLFRAPQGPDSDSLLYESTPGIRRTYFDTSATAHANYDPAYIVEPHQPGTKLAFNGLPVFPLYYTNDDASDRDIGADSRLTFTAPADGAYLVKVTDTAGASGDRYVYRLTIREPRPDFNVTVEGVNLNVPVGSGQMFTLVRQRIDGFDGDIRVDIGGTLPPGYRTASPIVIEAGHRTATGTLYAAADAPKPEEANAAHTKLTATAMIEGKSVIKEIGSLGKIAQRGRPQITVDLIPEEQPPGRAPPTPASSAGLPQITMAPGTMITARIKIDRNGFKGRVPLEVLNLPHGVIVDDLGLNGLLINEDESERQIFLSAAKWVAELDRPIYAIARVGENPTSAPVMFHVRKPGSLAAANK